MTSFIITYRFSLRGSFSSRLFGTRVLLSLLLLATRDAFEMGDE